VLKNDAMFQVQLYEDFAKTQAKQDVDSSTGKEVKQLPDHIFQVSVSKSLLENIAV